MRKPLRLFSTAIAVLATASAVAIASPGGAGSPVSALPLPEGTTVTLVTGDRVTVSGAGANLRVDMVTAARGREGMVFTRVRLEGHEYVYPADAADLVQSGRVDRRLFDVTGLVSAGYDDNRTARLPVLIDRAPGTARTVAPEGARTTRTLDRLGMNAVDVDKARAAGVWQHLTGAQGPRGAFGRTTLAKGIDRVALDGRVQASLDESVPQIGADKAHRAGLTGTGVTVAVLDTGYDVEHPDFAGVVTGGMDFTDEGTVDDGNGHGTHVASIIAGTGAASSGRYAGVAPGAKLLVGKVLNRWGSGSESQVLAGMEWAAASGARVVNMSLGSSLLTDGNDPLSLALNELTRTTGTLFVVAAGNSGAYQTIDSPGAADEALTVGSVTKTGEMSAFSSRGPRYGDYGIKPDVVAPGSDIVAARAAGAFPSLAVSERYARLSGTSMATPHVAGAAAILAQAHPDWRAAQLKAAITGTAVPVADADVYEQGAGRVDVAAAIGSTLQATPANLGTIHLTWPYASQQPQVRTLTYRNSGTSPLTLRLDQQLRAFGGERAPHGMARLSHSRLTVPAGGEAKVDITVDPGRSAAGKFGGWVLAHGPAGQEIRTPLAVYAEAETHLLTLSRAPIPAGKDRSGALTFVQNEATGSSWYVSVGDEPVELSLPAGTYRIFGHRYEDTFTGSAPKIVHFAHRLVMDRDRALTPDAGASKPVLRTLDVADTRMVDGTTGIVSQPPGVSGSGMLAPLLYGRHQVEAIPSTTQMRGLTFLSTAAWQQPLLSAVMLGGDQLNLEPSLISPDEFRGEVTGDVVDVGWGAPEDVAGLDLAGRVVLFTPGWGLPFDQHQVRLDAIMAKGPAAVLLSDGWAYGGPAPLLMVQTWAVQALREQLATGPAQVRVRGIRASSDVYFVAHTVEGRVPDGANWHDRADGLAAVTTRVATPGLKDRLRRMAAIAYQDGQPLPAAGATVRLPQELTLHYTPDVEWSTSTYYLLFGEEQVIEVAPMTSGPIAYRKGADRAESWFAAPFGPSLTVTDTDWETGAAIPYAFRRADKIEIALPMFSDAHGHATSPAATFDTGSTVLLRADGTEIGRADVPAQGVFDVPATRTGYRLTASAKRDVYGWPLSVEVRNEWTFTSEHVRGDAREPLLDVRYDLPVDGLGTAAAGGELAFTVSGTHQVGSPAQKTRVTGAQVWWSTDDGATWQIAAQTATAGGWRVAVPNPDTGFVSLRTQLTDAHGDTVTETIIRAYQVA